MNEVEFLFTDMLNYNREKLYLNENLILDRKQRHIISWALKRRIKGEPIQYILGKTEFMGLEFRVNKDVFIPRPETEILVETAIKFVTSCRHRTAGFHIMDIGTGSGCIAITMARSLSHIKIYATDISHKALIVARENARINGVEINFIQSNLFDACNLKANTYNLIVSNPPYIPSDEIKDLPSEVIMEPRIALDGGGDGLDFYRRIIEESPRYLKLGGFLIMEMGFGQYPAIKNIFQRSGGFKIIDVIKDYNDIERVIVAKFVNSLYSI